MVVLFFIFVLVGWALLATGARRALPLALSAAAAWLAWRMEGDVATTILVGLAVLAVVALIFDWLIVATRWRSTFIAVEAAGACAFGLVSGFAIVGSSGVSGTPLLLSMIAFALIATTVTLRFRTNT
jgi:hypothetical protein